MIEPIKAGDVCVVIDGAMKHRSPNLGKEVTVKSMQGNHTTLGVIWHCEGPDLVSLNDMLDGVVGGPVDFPAAWLRKKDQPAAAPRATQRELETQ